MPPLNNFQKSCIALAVSQALVIAPAKAADIVVTGDAPITDCTLKDAVASANTDAAVGNCSAGSGADVIQMHGQTASFATPNYGLSALQISSEIIIQGRANGAITNDIGIIQRSSGGEGPDPDDLRLFHVTSSGQLGLQHIAVVGGRTSGGENGGAIKVSSGGELFLQDATLTNNAAIGDGGEGGEGVYDGYGGAIAAQNGALLDIQNSVISGNTANFGAGIALFGVKGNAVNSTDLLGHSNYFYNNSAARYGGAIWADYASYADFTSTRFTNNQGVEGGGAIYWNSNAALHLRESQINNNTAVGKGGGLMLKSGDAYLDQVSGTRNQASDSGGFAHVEGVANLYLEESSFDGNLVGTSNFPFEPTIEGEGGALSLASGGITQLANSTITNNLAAQGSGISIASGSLRILNSTIIGGEGAPRHDARVR